MPRWTLPLLLLTLSVPAMADPISYIYSGRAAGSLAGTSFSNQQTTITAVGDTATVDSRLGGTLLVNQLSAIDVMIANVGSASFLGYSSIFYTDLGPGLAINGTAPNTGQSFFISEYALGGAQSLDLNYDMKSNFGPFPDTFISQINTAATTSGQLILNTSASPTTFTALVPEPGSLALLTVGMPSLLANLTRQHRRNV